MFFLAVFFISSTAHICDRLPPPCKPGISCDRNNTTEFTCLDKCEFGTFESGKCLNLYSNKNHPVYIKTRAEKTPYTMLDLKLDYISQTVFYIRKSQKYNGIYKFKLAIGNRPNKIRHKLIHSSRLVVSIAVDFIYKNIYFLDSSRSIQVMDYDGKFRRKVLQSFPLISPRFINFNVRTNEIYVVESTEGHKWILTIPSIGINSIHEIKILTTSSKELLLNFKEYSINNTAYGFTRKYEKFFQNQISRTKILSELKSIYNLHVNYIDNCLEFVDSIGRKLYQLSFSGIQESISKLNSEKPVPKAMTVSNQEGHRKLIYVDSTATAVHDEYLSIPNTVTKPTKNLAVEIERGNKIVGFDVLFHPLIFNTEMNHTRLNCEHFQLKNQCFCSDHYSLNADKKSCSLHHNLPSYLKNCSSEPLTFLPSWWFCDRDPDCLNGFDESHSPNGACTHSKFETSCIGRFKCEKSQACILPHAICDGVKDCRYGEDEESELCDSFECQWNYFKCPSFENYPGKCIEHYKICDGTKDCLGGEDELDSRCKLNGGLTEHTTTVKVITFDAQTITIHEEVNRGDFTKKFFMWITLFPGFVYASWKVGQRLYISYKNKKYMSTLTELQPVTSGEELESERPSIFNSINDY